MIATLASFALPCLFIGSAVFALATLALTWRAYGRELGALRAQLAACPDLREYQGRVATTRVHEFTSGLRRSAIRARAGSAPARRSSGRRAVA
jgi:hypothetical protein